MRVRKYLAGAALLFLLSQTAFACQEQAAILGGLSYHLNRDKEYNERNEAFGFQSNCYRVFVFDNSYHQTAIAFVKSFRYKENLYLDLGGAAGYEQRPVTPVLFARWSKYFGRVSLDFSTNVAVSFLSINYRL